MTSIVCFDIFSIQHLNKEENKEIWGSIPAYTKTEWCIGLMIKNYN